MNGSTATAEAAALLEAVARDTEDALDAEVPILCGRAADLLRGRQPAVPVPRLPDEEQPLRRALARAIDLLESDHETPQPVVAAALEVARAAQRAAEL